MHAVAHPLPVVRGVRPLGIQQALEPISFHTRRGGSGMPDSTVPGDREEAKFAQDLVRDADQAFVDVEHQVVDRDERAVIPTRRSSPSRIVARLPGFPRPLPGEEEEAAAMPASGASCSPPARRATARSPVRRGLRLHELPVGQHAARAHPDMATDPWALHVDRRVIPYGAGRAGHQPFVDNAAHGLRRPRLCGWMHRVPHGGHV